MIDDNIGQQATKRHVRVATALTSTSGIRLPNGLCEGAKVGR
jgi:hypothetical protein